MNDKNKKIPIKEKVGLIVLGSCFIVMIIVMIFVMLSLHMEAKTDLSNSMAEEFYVKQSEVYEETKDEVTTEEAEKSTEEEETTQYPAEIAATQEVREDLIGNGLSAEEWDYIYEQADKNAPEAVQPFTIVEFSNSAIKLYDANYAYYEWVPN